VGAGAWSARGGDGRWKLGRSGGRRRGWGWEVGDEMRCGFHFYIGWGFFTDFSHDIASYIEKLLQNNILQSVVK
jgi:hypothetical protein